MRDGGVGSTDHEVGWGHPGTDKPVAKSLEMFMRHKAGYFNRADDGGVSPGGENPPGQCEPAASPLSRGPGRPSALPMLSVGEAAPGSDPPANRAEADRANAAAADDAAQTFHRAPGAPMWAAAGLSSGPYQRLALDTDSISLLSPEAEVTIRRTKVGNHRRTFFPFSFPSLFFLFFLSSRERLRESGESTAPPYWWIDDEAIKEDVDGVAAAVCVCVCVCVELMSLVRSPARASRGAFP
jgi:hypothetical protein